MSYWTIVLTAIGTICIVVSLMNSRHSRSSVDHIAVHRHMSDDRIRKQLEKGRWRVDATLGIQFGVVFIVMGLAWQILLWMYWF
ncbi:MAG: hypothetical protein Aurels2KO_44000 [Aureliella sp.]